MLKAFAILSFSCISLVAACSSAASTPLLMQKASRVAVCEEGGWHNAHGPKYFGALGWLDATWLEFRTHSDPRFMDQATPLEQAGAMARFARVYGWPDQQGCQGGY